MRVMAAAVLAMESILMGFALLIAKDSASSLQQPKVRRIRK